MQAHVSFYYIDRFRKSNEVVRKGIIIKTEMFEYALELVLLRIDFENISLLFVWPNARRINELQHRCMPSLSPMR